MYKCIYICLCGFKSQKRSTMKTHIFNRKKPCFPNIKERSNEVIIDWVIKFKMKPIPYFPGYFATSDGNIWSKHKDKFTKPEIDRHGRRISRLTVDSKLKGTTTARLIAMTFLDLPENFKDLTIDHLNGDCTDDRVENLEWVTRSENSIRLNNNITKEDRIKRVSKKPITVTNIETGEEQEFESIAETGRQLDCFSSNIQKAVKGRIKTYKGHTFKYVTTPDLIGEIWKTCGPHGNEVSNKGRIRSYIRNPTYGSLTSGNYRSVGIGNKSYLVHRLVAEHFLDTPSYERILVDHIDGNRQNNHVENLRWCTHKENMNYAKELKKKKNKYKKQKKEA